MSAHRVTHPEPGAGGAIRRASAVPAIWRASAVQEERS